MPAVVVVLLLAFFGLLMRMSYKRAVHRWEVETGKTHKPVRPRPRAAAPKYPLVGPPEYPHGVVQTAIGDFGESCLEVDVRSWFYVRELELGIYNFYWHTDKGVCLPAGITPAEEREAELLAVQQQAVQEHLAKLAKAAQIRGMYTGKDTKARKDRIVAEGMVDEDPGIVPASYDYYANREALASPCFCDCCRGAAGVHGEDARALYVAKTEQAFRQQFPHRVQPEWVDPYYEQKQLVQGVRMEARAMPPSPWGYEMDARLRKAGLRPDTEDALEYRWTEDRRSNLTEFTVIYHGSRMYNAILIGDSWHVTDDNRRIAGTAVTG